MIKLYNTLSSKLEQFAPIKPAQLNMFVCGPTTYDVSHIGHARTYIVYDALAKFLRRAGFKLFYLQNITDIDDKVINRAKERDQDPLALSRKCEKEYLEDIAALGISSVDKYARATE